MMRMRFLLFALAAALVLAAGCVMDRGGYQDSRVYDRALYGSVARRAFECQSPARNPVIVIHGLMGARLTDGESGETVWGVFSVSGLRNRANDRLLAHPMGLNVPLNELHNPVTSAGLLEQSEIQVMGMSFNFSNYAELIRILEGAGYVSGDAPLPDGIRYPTLFIFDYDWRRDISENAVLLGQFIAEKRRMLREEYRRLYGLEDFPVKFDLIGHSMGGLVAGYYLRYGGVRFPDDPQAEFPVTWAGSGDVDKVIMVGTPNAGYLDTALEITGGMKLSSGAPLIPPAVFATFPSMYQMLPDPASGAIVASDGSVPDLWDVNVWTEMQWGLADPAEDEELTGILPEVSDPEERRAIALDHLRKCLLRAEIFRKLMRVTPEDQPDDVKFFLIAGDALETNHTALVGGDGSLSVIRREAGDGKITAASARYDLRDGGEWAPYVESPIRWQSVCYLQGGHMGIMNSPAFESNLLYILMAWPNRSVRELWEKIR